MNLDKACLKLISQIMNTDSRTERYNQLLFKDLLMSRQSQKPKNNQHYFTVWRWHFYSGIFIAPFLIILACSALGMLLMSNITGRDYDRLTITPHSTVQTTVSTQAKAALESLPNSTLVKYVAPREPNTVALFQVKSETQNNMVAVDPYTAEIVKHTDAK